ncbi:MAG: glycosyltransferase family 4 protein [Elusimicrobia bacterium]|nr:glycosyltransferase family 4 protein [Elusimicrobiota bacterium]
MRILHLITRLDVGGSSENAILSAEGLVRKGFEILLASGPSSALNLSEKIRSKGIRLTVLPDLVREIHPLKDLKAFFQVLRLLKEWKPDILHTHSSKAGFLGRWAAWLYNKVASHKSQVAIRVVHTPHGHVFYGYFGWFMSTLFLCLEKATAWVTDVLVAISEGERQESLERGMGRSEQWVVIPSGIDFSEVQNFCLPGRRTKSKINLVKEPGQIWVGTVARLEPVKGVEILVEAAIQVLASVPYDYVRFLIVGDGQEKSRLEAMSESAGVSKQVIFVGYQKEVLDFMRAMDIYVQPSLNEGMGKTLILAQRLGIPVVASRVCGIPDMVEDEKSGLLVPPGDPEALAQAISQLLRDAEWRARLSQSGLASVLRQDGSGLPYFSADSMISKLERLYIKM